MTVSVSTREEPLDLAYTLLSGQDFNNKLGNQKSQVTSIIFEKGTGGHSVQLL